jgi:hypothetical protein
MRTASEMNAIIGTRVYLQAVPGLRVLCTVTNAKTSYGTPRVEIEPCQGEGRAWVNFTSVVSREEREAR